MLCTAAHKFYQSGKCYNYYDNNFIEVSEFIQSTGSFWGGGVGEVNQIKSHHGILVFCELERPEYLAEIINNHSSSLNGL